MSAYALPGLFPPVEDTSSSSTSFGATSTSTTTPFTSLASGRALPAPLSSSPTIGGKAGIDQQESLSTTSSTSSNATTGSDHDQTHSKRSIGSTSTPLHSSYAYLPPLKSLDDEFDCSSSSTSSGMLGIAIKEAKIDPVRLVQYLTGSNSSTNKTMRRRGPKERMTINGTTGSPQGSPVHRRSVVDVSSDKWGVRKPRNPHNAHSSKSSSNSPHNEAIEFELSITFQGRRYTAKRTMQCMIKLRDDLIREMNTRRHWLTRQMPPIHTTATASTDEESSNSDTPHTIPPTIEIPEIPTLNLSDNHHPHDPSSSSHHSRVGGIGFVGRGFTMLHAMVTSYVPVMDRWLKTVMAVVPQDSECLLNFLWEPPSNNENANELVSFGSILESSGNNKNQSISMGSIKELDIEEEEEDDA
ncbi:hypothetical protein IV203_035591 [Nitzschia inconspicua]|uniref:Uncharacterized protein n=1 Tax=Nitzschia inconspicua TaxID=303405 RepID=A0A9K3PUT7_9STRA|nr:hypothetical protein IV203_035591 [Nitzschia inconspicua]